MIRFEKLASLFISSLLQISLVQSQWNGGFASYEQNFIPYYPAGNSFAPGNIQYIPMQGPPLGDNIYPTQNVQPFEERALNVQYLPANSPIYSNTPSVSYQGVHEANALRSAYPNQPIIIINNGGNGDTGSNSNNNNNKGSDDGINFKEIAAFLFATGKGGLGGGLLGGKSKPEHEPVRPTSHVTAPPSKAVTQETNSACGCSGNNKCSTVTHITIVLPSSGGSVEVKQKNKGNKKKNDDKNGGKQKKAKVDEDSITNAQTDDTDGGETVKLKDNVNEDDDDGD